MVVVAMEFPRFAAGAVLTLRIAYGVALIVGPAAARAPVARS